MHLQIGDDLRTVHNAQLVYLNHQDIALTLFTRFKIRPVHNCQTEEDHLNIKIVTALLLYNASTLLNMMEICVTNNNKLEIHPRRMAIFKNNSSNCKAVALYQEIPRLSMGTRFKFCSSLLKICIDITYDGSANYFNPVMGSTLY